jgi:transposase
VRAAATCIQRMQKALTQMNVQLANVISDISGLTGQAIVGAIVAGERDTRKLAALCHPRIQASREEIAKSLARKIAAIILIMWKKGVSFDPQQVQRQAV